MSEYILHYGAVTLRVNGAGSLRGSFIGLDDIIINTLHPLTMASAPGREPTILANTKSQRARLKLETTAIDEVMKINRIVVWTKALYTQYPG